ncbi:MAG: hypothetical protein AB7F19_04355 [Candidatus Babeliales bacterium]
MPARQSISFLACSLIFAPSIMAMKKSAPPSKQPLRRLLFTTIENDNSADAAQLLLKGAKVKTKSKKN